MSIDEQTAPQNEMPLTHQQQQQQYAQFNGHATQHFSFPEGTSVQEGEVVNSFSKKNESTFPNFQVKISNSSVVALKSQAGDSTNAPPNDISTPPSANAGISSATPTTASQMNHVETEPTQQAPVLKNEPPAVDPQSLKHELKNSCDEIKAEEEEDDPKPFDKQSELNGPTSTVAE
jgi:hypothetical protein